MPGLSAVAYVHLVIRWNTEAPQLINQFGLTLNYCLYIYEGSFKRTSGWIRTTTLDSLVINVHNEMNICHEGWSLVKKCDGTMAIRHKFDIEHRYR